MNMKRSLVPLLVVPALLAFSELGEQVSYAPKAGLTLTKTFSQKDETMLDDMSVVMNGEEQDPSMAAMEQEISNHLDVKLTDEYASVADGRPTVLKRTFDKIAAGANMKMSNQMMGDMTINMKGTSELEGQTVVFTWNEDDGAYAVKFAEEGGADEALLEDLTEDTDLRALLPTSDVEEGTTWEVEPEELRKVLAFGGALKLDMEAEDMPEIMSGFGDPKNMPSADQFLGEMEGTVTAEYRGSREEEGVRVAVIHVALAVNSAKDMTDFFREAMEEAEMPEGMEMKMDYKSVDMEFELEGEATLLWNLGGGHLHSFELVGKGSTTMDMAVAMEIEGMGSMDFEMSMLMKSDSTITLSATASE